MSPEQLRNIQQILGKQIGMIARKDPLYKAGGALSGASLLGGAGGALFSEDGIEPGGAGLTGAGYGAGAGIGAAGFVDVLDTINKEAKLRSETGMKSAVPKVLRNPKRAALMAAIGMLGGGSLGYGVGKLFEDK